MSKSRAVNGPNWRTRHPSKKLPSNRGVWTRIRTPPMSIFGSGLDMRTRRKTESIASNYAASLRMEILFSAQESPPARGFKGLYLGECGSIFRHIMMPDIIWCDSIVHSLQRFTGGCTGWLDSLEPIDTMTLKR